MVRPRRLSSVLRTTLWRPPRVGLEFLYSLGFTSLRWLVWAQPQRDVRGLHRLPHHAHQIVVQRFQVRLVPELGGEGFEGLLASYFLL